MKKAVGNISLDSNFTLWDLSFVSLKRIAVKQLFDQQHRNQ